jgi:hypothetical protein
MSFALSDRSCTCSDRPHHIVLYEQFWPTRVRVAVDVEIIGIGQVRYLRHSCEVEEALDVLGFGVMRKRCLVT